MWKLLNIQLSKHRVGAALLALLLISSGAVVAYTTVFNAGSGTAYETGSGLIVSTSVDHGLDGTNPFNDSETVYIDGVSISSSGTANVTVDQFRGTTTNLSSIDASTNTITVNPDDKSSVRVSGAVTKLSWKDAAIDGSNQITYSASGGGTIVATGLASSTDWTAATPSGVLIDSGVTTAGGEASIDVTSATDEELILFTNTAPAVDNASASPSGQTTTKDQQLTIDVSDAEFATTQGDELTVEFFVDGSSVGTDTLTSNGTASTTVSGLVGGSHEWEVVVTDSYGAQTTSQTFEFQVPDQLFIRNVSNTSQSITSTAEVTFLAENTIVENSTADGTINLTGLPVDETMVVEVTASNYHTRTTIIESIYQQQTIYMLNTSKTSVEVRFTLEDNTGEFDSDSSYLIVERPLTINGTTNWVTVTGDYFGVNGFTTDLEDGQRYRLSVKNGVGDERVLGTYTASASETVQLTIGEVTSLPGGCDCTVTHNATYDDSGATTYVRYDYNDTLTQTSELHVAIYEKGNESNVLFPNTTYTDLGTVAVVEAVPAAENETTWAVDVTGVRDGESFAFKKFVGPRSPALPSLPGWVKAIISIGSIWIVAGLFSQLNGNVGAVATAGLGGMWWYVDFLPQETGIGVVVLSLITAGILMVQSQRGGV